MKKLKFLFFGIVISTSIVSCSKDDNTVSESDQILGKWTVVEELVLDANDNVLDRFVDEPTPCPIDYFDFKTDGTVIDYYTEYYKNACNEYTNTEKWTLEGNVLTFEYSNGDIDPYTIAIKGEVLELVQPLNERNESYYDDNVAKLKSVYKRI